MGMYMTENSKKAHKQYYEVILISHTVKMYSQLDRY